MTSFEYRAPTRAVLQAPDIDKWENSEAYQDVIGFITSMNDAVKGKPLSYACTVSSEVQSVLDIIQKLDKWVDEILPIDQPQRYGNKAYRDFYEKLKQNCENILKEALPDEHHPAIIEICPYLIESFGNSTRIDYGTGHELSFAMFLACLFKINYLKKEDSVATVLKIFKSYLDLARKLQATYKMEPAGSQGVWSLDDYQFLPFIWGSSQLFSHPKIAPEMFVLENIVEQYHHDYLFLSCIKYIISVKTGPFAEHSNQLWNISGVASWTKINQGLIKMYKAEVLNKFPVIQHVLFGSILSISEAKQKVFHPPSSSALGRGVRLPQSSGIIGLGTIPGRMPQPPMGVTDCMPGRLPPMGMTDCIPGRMPPVGSISGMMPPVGSMPGKMPPVGSMPGADITGVFPGKLPQSGSIQPPCVMPKTTSLAANVLDKAKIPD